MALGVFLVTGPQQAQAATTSSNLNFQARLLNNLGGVVPDGNYNIDFKIYNADSTTGSVGTCTGACLWEETRKNSNSQGVQVINGYFSVNLGSVTSFPAINWDQQLWLTMNIGGTTTGVSPTWDGEMQNAGHSIALTALPYSFVAGQLALTSGAHRGTLGFNTVANDPNILLPDASGTVCLQAASACGFETTTGTDFIQNQSASVQTASFNISGTGSITTAVQVPLVQTADSAAANTANITFRSGNETGSSLSSGTVTIKSGDAAGGTNSSSGNITIDSGTKSGTGSSGTISIGTANASAISIGLSGKTTTVNGALTVSQILNANGGINVAANQSILLNGGNTASRPGSPTAGTLYFDTTTNQLIQYNGTKWNSAPKSNTFIVAANNSSQAEKDAADAVATGTGDQATINGFFTSAPCNTVGCTVYLMEGTYTLSAAISMPNNSTLSGAGAATIITVPNAQNGSYSMITNTDTSTGTNVTIKNLLVDGNSANQTLGTMNGILFDHVGSGTTITGGNISATVVKNVFGASGYSIYLSNSSNNTVIGNIVQGGSASGIFIYNSSKNTVSGNVVEGNTSVGIYLNNSSSTNNTITGNTVQGNVDGIIVNNTASHNVITGNSVSTNSTYGINLGSSSSGNVVSANKIQNNGGSTDNNGIYLNSSSTKNSITDNDITDSGCSSTCYAINISDAGSTGNYISSNHFLGDGTHAASIANPNGDIETLANQQLSESGDAAFRNNVNSATAFQIQNASGTNLFNVDTTNSLIGTAATSTASTNTQDFNLRTGNATGSTSNSGSLKLDVGTATGTTGSILIGTVNNANAITIGSTTQTTAINLGQSTASNTINIGAAAGASNTQTINIGTSSTGSSTTNVNIGSSVAGTTTVNGALTLNTGKNFTVNGDVFTDLTGTGITDISNALSIDQSASLTWTGTEAFNGATTFTPSSTNNVTFTGDNDSNIQVASTLSSDVTQTGLALSLTDNASASTGTVYGLSVTNADNGANTGVPDALAYLKNANAAETVADGLLVEQTGAGTLSNGLEVKQTAGAVTNGLTFTGTFTKLINSTNFNVTNAGAVTAASLDTGSGTIQTTGTVNGNTIDREASGTLSIGTGQASAITLGGSSTVTTAAGGLTVTTGKNFTVNGDVFTDLTGTGIADISNALSIDQSASLTWTGLEAISNNNAAGFKVSDSSSSKTVLTVDTSGDTVILGNSGASGITGTLKFNFSGQTGSITLDANNPSSTGYTLHLPTENGTLCVQNSVNCGFISGSGAAFVQGGNSFSATGTLGTTDANGLNIITNNHIVLGLSSTGAATFENFSDSATGFQIQTSTASAMLNINTSDGYIINNGAGNLGNEIQNPSFESSGTTDATGWYTPSATQVITNSAANAHSGNYELQVTGNSSTHAVYTKYYAVHPGDTIYTEAWVKNSAGATGDAGIYIEYDDKNKASTTFTNADTGLPGTSYVKKTITDTVPAGSYFLRIAASVKATATTGTFYFDDFYLKKANESAPLLITNTSSTAFQVQNSSAVTVLGVDATTGKIFSNIATGGSAIGFTLNTSNSLSTAGAKLLSVQNSGTEEFSVDKDGNVNIPSAKFYEVGGSQIATANLNDGGSIAMKNAANTFSSTNSFQVTNTNGFQVQDAGGTHTYIQADTNGGSLYLGNTQTGSTVQIGNSTGAAVTQTISIGSSNTTASSASTITIGSTIGGSLTLQPGGGIIVAAGALGTADNTSYLCRNSSNKIAGCITTGTGVAFVNGGNTLGSLSGNLATIGTNDANSLQIKTNNVGRATFDQSNNLYLGNADATGVNAAPNNFSVKGTGSSTTGTAGGDVNLYGGAGNATSTGSAGGNITINGGAAAGTGDNAGGSITLVAGVNTGAGAAGGVLVKNAANSTSAFQVQTTGSATVFSVNTSTPTVTVAGGTVFASNTYTSGANSTITQSLVDNNTTISATATATSLTFTVPAPTTATTGRLLYIGNGGSNSFVLNIGATSFTLAPGSSATLLYIGSAWSDAGIDASTLQLGYTNSVGSTTPEIKLDSTRQTLNIQDADSTIGADILDINASNGGGGGLGTVLFGVGNTGATKIHTTGSGSATAFIVQNANNANFITVDTTSGGNSVSLDSDTGSAGTIKIGNVGGHAQTVNIGLTASNASNSTINIATNANASATNAISIGSNGNAANGVTIEAGNTGGINLGNTDVAHTVNIANGGSATAQTVNIGSNSSTGAVNVKAGGSGITLNTNGATAGTVVKSVTSNSTVAFQVQNASANSLFNVDTSGNIITLGSTAQALANAQGIKIYGGNSTSSAVDLVTPADASSNSLFYGANNSRAQFGFDGTNGNAAVKAASSYGFEVQTGGSSSNVMTIGTTGLVTLQPSASLTAGQSALAQTLTAGQASGTVNGYSQTITVAPSAAATTNGFNIALTDATTFLNSTNAINVTLTDNGSATAKLNTGVNVIVNGSNTSQVQVGVSAQANRGIGLLGSSSGTGASFAACGAAANSIGVCGTSSSSTNGYGGIFSVSGSSTGAALAATNITTTSNILQLLDNTTPVVTVADNGVTTFKNSADIVTAFQIQNAAGVSLFRADTANLTLNTGGNILPTQAATVQSTSTLITAAASGETPIGSAMVIGPDSMPLIAYANDVSSTTIKVIHCTKADCSTSTSATVDSSVGDYTNASVPNNQLRMGFAIGSDGLPVLTYYNQSSHTLKFTHCGNITCSAGNSTITLDSTTDRGWYSSLAIASDGNPAVAYYDNTNGDLRYVHCTKADCSTTDTKQLAFATNDAGNYASITIGSDGLPVIAHWVFISGASKADVYHCATNACASGTNSVLSTGGNSTYGKFTSIAIGSDGLPIVSYVDGVSKIAISHCAVVDCSSGTVTTDPPTGMAGTDTYAGNILIGRDGLAIVVGQDTTGSGIPEFIHCSNVSCTTADHSDSPEATSGTGNWGSIAIGANGIPVMAYAKTSATTGLNLTRCGSATSCTSGVTSTAFGGGINVGSSGIGIQTAYINNILTSDAINPFTLSVNGAQRIKVDPGGTSTFTGYAVFKPFAGADSTTALQIQNSSARSLLSVDSTNSVISIGNSTDGSQISFGATGNVSSVIRKSMIVNGSIGANDLVQIDTANAGQVKQAVASSTNVFGVATSAVGSGSAQDIVIAGLYQVNANSSGGTVNVGDTLVSSSTAGQVTKAGSTTASGSVVGLAMSAISSGKVWVFINLGLGGSDNLQTVYNKSVGGTTPEVKVDSTRGGIDIQDADTATNTSLLTVRNSNSSGLGAAILDVQSSNPITDITNNANNNLITNGSFENNVTGWAAKGSASAPAQNSTYKYIGSSSAQVVTTAAANDGTSYNVTLSDSTAYNLVFSLRLDPSSAGFATLAAGYNNGSSDSNCTLNSTTVVSSGWTTFNCTFTTAATHSGTPAIYIKQTDANIHTFYVDAVQLSRYSILSNASAEVAFAAGDWQKKTGSETSVTQVNTQHQDGSNSVQVVTTGSTQGTKHNETLNDSTQYNLTFYAKANGSNFSTLEAGYNDGSSNTVCITAQTVVTTGWTAYSCVFTTTSSHSGTPYFYVDQTDATGRTFFLDNFQLTIGVPLGAYQEGKIALNGIISTPISLQSQSNSSTALQIQNANGSTLFSVDTVNTSITITAGTVNTTLALGDLAAGSIGTAPTTVDIYTSFTIAPTASGRAYTIPTPTLSTAYGRTIYIGNIGSTGNYFTISGIRIPPGSTATLIWSNTNGGASWQFAGAGGSSIENQNSADQTATFRINGSGTINNSGTTAFQVQDGSSNAVFTVDTTNGIIQVGSSTSNTSTQIFALNNNNGTTTPTEVDGGMYYNNSTGQFLCGENGFWVSCGVPPRDHSYDLYDEFMSGNSGTLVQGAYGIGSLNWFNSVITGGGSAPTIVYTNNPAAGGNTPTADVNRPGILNIEQTGSGNQSGQTLGLGVASMVLGTSRIDFKTAVNIASTSNLSVYIGLHNITTNNSAPTTGVYWKESANGTWQYCYINATPAEVCANSAVTATAGAWARLEIVIVSSTEVDYYINGTKIAVTGITYNTTNKIAPAFSSFKTNGANSTLDIYLDYFQLTGTTTTSR